MPTTGTLYELDMILSITQRTINDQLEALYWTPLADNPNDYLISHTLRVGFFKGVEKDPDTGKEVEYTSPAGLEVTVFTPTVDINDVPHSDFPRSLRLNFHIEEGKLHYISQLSGKLMTKDVSGFRMSWVANLGRRNIPDVNKERMHPEAKKKILDATKYEGSEAFLVSSLFCEFENASLIESFALYDAEGKLMDTKQSFYSDFINNITTHFSHLSPDANPYVLGYGVEQKITQTVEKAEFAPASYIFSTTPWPYGEQDAKTDELSRQATLNFLILGAGEHDPKLVTIKENPKVGIITEPFVNVTRAPKEHSYAILGISRNMFFQQYMKPRIIDVFKVKSPEKVSGQDVSAQAANIYETPRSYKYTQSWTIPKITYGELHQAYENVYYSGSQSLEVSWSSALQDSSLPSTTSLAADTKRLLTVSISGHVTLSYKCYAWSFPSDEGQRICTDYIYDTDITYSAALKFTTGTEGKWVLDEKKIDFPGRDGSGKLDIRYDESKRPPPAKWYETLLHAVGGMGSVTGTDEMKGYLAAILDPILTKEWEQKISTSVSDLRNKVILPAGDVFDFKGLDVDSDGNLYSHLQYKSIMDPSHGHRK